VASARLPDELQEALAESRLCQRDHWANFNADQLGELYDSEITSVLDRLIPAKTVTIGRRPSDPWFDSECRQSKREVRRLERSSRRLKTPEATSAWYSKRHQYRALLWRKRECFWQAKIEAEKSKPCQLWRSIDALLGRGKTPLPADIDAAQFHNFFDDKVAGVRSTTSDAPPPSFSPNPSTASFSQFQSVTVNDVIAAVRALPDKTCALEPLPTTHLKAVVGVIAPFLTSLFNKLLLSGFVPEGFKVAYITSLVKKSGMDNGDVRSYRPISNLSVASKLLERIAAKQLIAYLEKSALLPRLQSAYRTGHSSETAVLKVLSDILLGIDAGDLSALVLYY